jgi:hypothetical protein
MKSDTDPTQLFLLDAPEDLAASYELGRREGLKLGSVATKKALQFMVLASSIKDFFLVGFLIYLLVNLSK